MPNDDRRTSKEALISALGKLGSEHELPPVDDAPADYRTRVMALAWRRLNRLLRLLAGNAPDSIVAVELGLIGEVGPMLDPRGMGRRYSERHERQARMSVGLCHTLGCPHEPADDGLAFGNDHCVEHATKYREQLDAEVRGADADDKDPGR